MKQEDEKRGDGKKGLKGTWFCEISPQLGKPLPIMERMVSVSMIIPAWNESERIAQCLLNATTQTVPAHEVIVVDNLSTDNTSQIVEDFIANNPQSKVILLHQNAEQGLIPSRNYGFNHATGDILGRFDADCMIKPDWVEVVSEIFEENPKAMGATGPCTYYDMPGKVISLAGDNSIRKRIYIADGKRQLLYGSNMAVRRSAWEVIKNEVCRDKEDIMHEDIDLSLHLFDHDFETVYSPDMITAVSARRMDTSLSSFRSYMRRFKNTFDAHPQHWRDKKPEYTLTALYPMIHAFYPTYQKHLEKHDIDPAEEMWINEWISLAERDKMELPDHLAEAGFAQANPAQTESSRTGSAKAESAHTR